MPQMLSVNRSLRLIVCLCFLLLFSSFSMFLNFSQIYEAQAAPAGPTLTLVSKGTNFIEVSWPKGTDSTLFSYTVNVYQSTTYVTSPMVNENGSQTYTYKIQNLNPGTTYSIDVGYENDYGFYYNTPVLNVTTDAASGPVTYNVVFESNGGSAVATQTINQNGKATQPSPPTQTNYIFDGWYTNQSFTTLYDFNAVVTANLTLYAKWTNIAPTAILLSNSKLDENKPIGTTVGTLSAQNGGPSPTFALVSGLVDSDNSLFTIDGTTLKTAASFDYETKSFYTIRIRVTGVSASTYEQFLFITVNNLDEVVPGAPISLSGTEVTSSSVDLLIGFASDNVGISNYEIFVNNSYADTFTPATVETAYSYTLSGLSQNTNYQIKVRAVDAAGNKSAFTSAINITTQKQSPTVPSGLTVTTTTGNSISVNWNASTDVSGVLGYNVFLNGNYVASTAGRKYTFKNLSALTTYQIKVSAYNTLLNKSAKTTAVSATTLDVPDTTPPTQPSFVTATAIKGDSVKLVWTPSSDNKGVAGYHIRVNGVYFKTIYNNSTVLTGLNSLTGYIIRVQAFDAANNRSILSDSLSVTTIDGIAPTAPTNVTVVNQTSSGFRVNWTPATDNVGVKYYNIFLNNSYYVTIDGTANGYTFMNLSANTTYQITVRALDAERNGTDSSPVTVNTTP